MRLVGPAYWNGYKGWYEASMSWALKLVQGWYYGKSLPGWCRLQSYQPCRGPCYQYWYQWWYQVHKWRRVAILGWSFAQLSIGLSAEKQIKLSWSCSDPHFNTCFDEHMQIHVLTIIVRPMFWWAYTDPCFDDHIQIHVLMIIFRSMFWWLYSDPCFDI
jgi:hypothetical protein